MSDQPPPLKDPFAIGDDERDARARRTPVPNGPAELPDPFAQRQRPVENTPAPSPATRAVRRPALSDTPVARKPFTQVMPAAETPPGAPAPGLPDTSDLRTVVMPVSASGLPDTSDLRTVVMPEFVDLTGRESTMPGTPAEGSTPAPVSSTLGSEPDLLTGRELTMPGTPAEGSTPAPGAGTGLSGAEPTLLTGRELTMPGTPAEGSTPAPGTDATRVAMHTPRTMPGIAGMVPRGGRSTVGKPATGTRNTPTATNDDAWHYQGRAGQFTGQEWGDWDIGGILGEGGMGAVYRAKQRSLNRRVALKVLSPNLAADLRLLQRFQLEARTASLLASPNVVQVFAAGEFEGNHFFVMEYVEGRDLYDVMKERAASGKPFTPDEAADIVIQAAKGLAEAGRIGVVHRDIKPPNLMVTNDGLVKVADFGIVKVMGEAVLTMTGQAVGTPSYVSPEQGRGEANIDQRSDLYSLGVVFYELLTGKKPFEGSTPNAIIYQHCYGEPTLPREINPAIDEKYQAVVLKCLQKKPENRYQNANELIRDLEDIRSGRMLATALASYRQGTGADEAKRENMSWAQRHLLALVASIGVAVLAGGFGIWQLKLHHDGVVIEEQIQRDKAKGFEQSLARLDGANPIQEDEIGKLLEEYAALPFINRERLEIWRNKLRRVAALRKSLEVLNGRDDLPMAVRRKTKSDLVLYKREVGKEDARAIDWTIRDKHFDDLAEDAERQLRAFDKNGNPKQADVDAIGVYLTRYKTMMGPDEPLAQRVEASIAAFVERRDRLKASLARLDQKNVVITDTMRERMLIEVDLLAGMVDEGEQIASWRMKLKTNNDRINQLRARLRALDSDKDGRLPTSAQLLALESDFAEFKELADDNDPDMRAWKAKFVATPVAIASLRKTLARLDQPNPLSRGEIKALEEKLAELRVLAGEGDAQYLDWRTKHQDKVAYFNDLGMSLTRLDREPALTLAEQQALAKALKTYAELDGLPSTEVDRYRARLDEEQRSTAARVESLAALDQVASFTDELRAALAIYTQQAGETPEVVRWNAKRMRIEALRAQLAPLDRIEPLPEGVEAAITQLAAEVGDKDRAVIRWRLKVDQVSAIAAALAPLDRPEPLPADARAHLAEFVKQVGDLDARYRRWQAKVDRVAALAAALGQALAAYGHAPAEVAQMHADYRELTALVSPQDPQVSAWGPRLAHLDGPPRPAWAAASGRDDFGLWADLAVTPELLQRFRFVPAGSFTIGSPDTEPGHELDETQARVTLTTAFWLADTECTQALWHRITGRAPARHVGDDRPVERVSWTDAQEFIAKARERLAAPLRLPTEAEWEYAARAGGTGTVSSARSDATGLGSVAWYAANSGSASKAVKLRFANPIGLYDLHGNVWEWCQDRYAPYTTVPVSDPLGRDGETFVARGGSWGDPALALRVANRASLKRDLRSAYVGLRLACDVVWEVAPPTAAEPAAVPTAPAPVTDDPAGKAPVESAPAPQPQVIPPGDVPAVAPVAPAPSAAPEVP